MELSIDGYSNVINNEFKEFISLKESMNDNLMNNFFADCKQEIVKNLTIEFGLSQYFDKFKDGGNVATVHNAKNNVFPDKETEERYKNEYDHKNYDNELPERRKEMMQNEANPESYLTGKELAKDGSTHLDHVVSGKEIHANDEARLYMTDAERSKMAQDDKNLKPLESNINQSKGEHDLMDWKEKERHKEGIKNKEHFNIDDEKAKKAHGIAKKHVNSSVRNKKIEKVVKGGLDQGINMGKKQVVGLFLFHFSDGLMDLSVEMYKNWGNTNSISEKTELFANTIRSAFEMAKEKLKTIKNEVIPTVLTSVTSGFIASIFTTIINHFATTLKNMVKIINDSFHALLKACKLILTRPNGITFKEAIKEAGKIVAAAIIASGGVIITGVIKKFLLTTPLAAFANEIGGVIGVAITGIVTALVLFTINNFKKIIENIAASMKYITRTAEEIERTFIKTMERMDEAYKKILNSILEEYKKLGKLREMAFDFTLLSSEMFSASQEYARFLSVDEDEIIKSHSELENFIFN